MAPVVLLLGKDARTDAIAAACAASPCEPELYALSELAIPGLIEKCREVVLGSLVDVAKSVAVAERVRPDLVIVGPEEPLAAGVVDALGALSIPCFGPTRALAAIESSKSWARALVDRHGIDVNPRYRVFETDAGLREYMHELGGFVVKPDGLTAGKGVRVFGEHLDTLEAALAYAQEAIAGGGRVVIEQRLEGEEFSLQTITDGESVVHLPLVQDHKRAYDGDSGPNTGGMGSYSCPDLSLPFLADEDLARARRTNEAVIAALASDTGQRYRGVLYGGFMATAEGLRLIEYNARFGDPEAMNVLSLFRGDFVELCAAAAAGRLGGVEHSFERRATVCKYLVPTGYPESTEAVSEPIGVPSSWRSEGDLRWYWAACEQRGEEVLMTKSRAGAVVGIGATLSEAERIAERGAGEVSGSLRHRSDIGTDALVQARVEHMARLRANSRGPA